MSSDAYDAILTCRAVRHFTETPISDDDLQRILQAGRWAGSAKNVQPWHFVVVRNRARLNQLAECGRYASHLRGAALAVVLVTSPGRWVDFDAGRAAQNMMLAAWLLGIGSCIASLHDEDRARPAGRAGRLADPHRHLVRLSAGGCPADHRRPAARAGAGAYWPPAPGTACALGSLVDGKLTTRSAGSSLVPILVA